MAKQLTEIDTDVPFQRPGKAHKPVQDTHATPKSAKTPAGAGEKGTKKKAEKTSAPKKRSGFVKFLKWTFIFGLIFSVPTGLGIVYFASKKIAEVEASLPKIDELMEMKFEVTTEIYDYTGTHLMGEIAQMRRTEVKLADISPNLINAFVAGEDKNFYQHDGVDYEGIANAIARRALGKRLTGASTLTQQEAKDLLNRYAAKKNPVPTKKPLRQRNFTAKLEEAILARQLTKRFDKNQVLEIYLNGLFLGNKRYGVEAGMQYYFGHSAKEATVSEAALIAALAKGANNYASWKTLEEKELRLAKWDTRRAYILGRMVKTGKIAQAQADAAAKEPINLVEHTNEKAGVYDEFIDLVEEQLKVEYGDQLLTAGLKVVTTCDYEAQRKAKEALERGLEQVDVMNGEAAMPQGAKIMIDETGAIRVLVGGYGYKRGGFNRALKAHRQAGSLFKTLLYGAGFDSGNFTPDSMVKDAEITLPEPVAGAGSWTPRNSHPSETDGQDVPAWYSLAKSLNTGTADLLRQMSTEQNPLAGIDAMIKFAREVGVKSQIGRNYAQILGTASVTVAEMATVYNTMSNGGKRPTPYVIAKIVNGKERTIKAPEQAIKSQTAKLTHQALLKVTEDGTGARARRELKRDVAGKTGTTQHAMDAWFCGSVQADGHTYTDCSWVGYDNNSPLGKIVKGRGAGHDFDGASAALSCLWIPFMKSFLGGKPVEEFPAIADAQVTAKPVEEVAPEKAEDQPVLNTIEQPAGTSQPESEGSEADDPLL